MADDTYSGPFANLTNQKTYDSVSSQALSGTTLNVNTTQANLSIAPAAPVTPITLTPAPTYTKSLSTAISTMTGSALTSMANSASTQGAVSTISNAIGSAGTLMSSGLGAIDAGVSSVASPIGKGITTLNEYIGPTVATLNNLSNIGKEFDKIIKDSFFGQLTNIKGTEIICTAFCILISFLPCDVRNKLANTIDAIKTAMTQSIAVVSAVNDIAGMYNSTMAGAKSVTEAASSLFGNKSTSNLLAAPFKTTSNGMSASGGAALILAAPEAVKNVVKQLNTIIQLISKAKISLPIGLNGELWDLAAMVLFALQTMVMQMADEMLTKIIKPIEDQLKKMIPQICIGNLATIFFNKIIAAIKAFKAWILQQIAELFGASKAFGIKWKTFGLNFKGLIDLLFLLKALNLCLTHFFDLALACGIDHCGTQPKTGDSLPVQDSGQAPTQDAIEDPEYTSLVNAIRSGNYAPMTNIPAQKYDYNTPNSITTPPHLDIIAQKLAPILKTSLSNIVVTPDQIQVTQPEIVNAPRAIAALIASEQFALELGPAYKIYSTPDSSNVKIVYTFNRSCGD